MRPTLFALDSVTMESADMCELLTPVGGLLPGSTPLPVESKNELIDARILGCSWNATGRAPTIL